MDLNPGKPTVTLYGEDAALLEPYLRGFERMCQAKGVDDSEAAPRVYAIRRLASRWISSAIGTAEVPELDCPVEALHDGHQTTKEAAEALDITDRGVRMAIKAGRLEGRKVGGVWQVAVWSVVAELERRREQKGA